MAIVSKDELESILKLQIELLSETTEQVVCLVKNLIEFCRDFSNHETANKMHQEEIEQQFAILNNYINHVHDEIPSLRSAVKEAEEKLEDLQLKMESLTKECESQKLAIKELEQDNAKINEELEKQSSYSAAMGSVLATMLWKTSKTQEAIETYIETGTLNEFLNVACIVFRAFRETYEKEIPFPESYEYKFILAICGLFVNIVAQRDGRNFILERDAGVDFVKSAILYLKDVPMPAGQLLKRLMLMMLFNLSITNRGALLIETSDNSIENILKCCEEINTPEIQSLALSIITSLLNELPTQEFCEKVIQTVNQEDLQRIINDGNDSIKFVCSKFIQKIKSLNEQENSFEY